MLCRVKRSFRFIRLLILLSVLLFLAACGGGGGGDASKSDAQPVVLTGVFLDAVVSGVNYQTATKSGVTNSDGEYNYVAGEQVTFSVGGVVLGTALAGPVVTPLLLVDGAADATDPRVVNIVRLLLSLDSDGIPDNGIDITPDMHTAAAALSLDFDSATFDTDAQSLLETVIGAGTLLVDASVAQTHFNTTLKTSWGTMTWGTDCWDQVCQ